MRRLVFVAALAFATGASAQTMTQCRWIGNIWSCDSQTQIPKGAEPVDQGAILRGGADLVKPVQPAPVLAPPRPPRTTTPAIAYRISREQEEMLAEVIATCPAFIDDPGKWDAVPEDRRPIIGAICYSYERGRAQGRR